MRHLSTSGSQCTVTRLGLLLILIAAGGCGKVGVQTPPPEAPRATPSSDAPSPTPTPAAPATGENPAESPEAAGTDTPQAADAKSATATSTCPTKVPSTLPAGLSEHCIRLGKDDRIYRVYKPSSLSAVTDARAAVILLHGGGGSAAEASDPNSHALGVFTTIADREQIVVVYPQGTPDSEGRNGWADCRADDQSRSGADDVAFLAELITQFQSKWSIDSARVFLAGTSNGAMMSYRFVMERSDLVAAVATSSGNLAAKPLPGRCQSGPERPVPILMTHGSADPVVPFEGGLVGCFGANTAACTLGSVVSTRETIDFWLGVHGLQNTSPVRRMVDTSQDDPGPAIESRYFVRAPITGAVVFPPKVISWDLRGAGHSPPSMVLDKGNNLVGAQSKDIEFCEEAWRFFKAHL